MINNAHHLDFDSAIPRFDPGTPASLNALIYLLKPFCSRAGLSAFGKMDSAAKPQKETKTGDRQGRGCCWASVWLGARFLLQGIIQDSEPGQVTRISGNWREAAMHAWAPLYASYTVFADRSRQGGSCLGATSAKLAATVD